MKKINTLTLSILVATAFSCIDNKGVIPINTIKGSWKCEDYSPLIGNRIYTVDINRSKSDTTLYSLSNFNNEGVDLFVIAHLKNHVLTIDPSQQIFGSQTIIKSGTGAVSDNFSTISFNYIVYNGINDINIRSIYTRPQ